MNQLCCPVESPLDHEARISAEQLKDSPINIFWRRRRTRTREQSLHEGGDGLVHLPQEKNRSPFPKSWSINYSGKSIDEEVTTIRNELVDKSGSCINMRLKHEKQRDASGYCKIHPSIQLAQKMQTQITRFPRIFSNNKNETSVNNKVEWDIIHQTCPQCEKEKINTSKARYQYKPKQVDDDDITTQQIRNPMEYVSFPATITLIDTHPHLEEGKMALMIRSAPVAKEETLHLSCAAGPAWKYSTPDGAMDSLIQCNELGGIIKQSDKAGESAKKLQPESQYHIMERVIPLSSIDHVSRGGDAWDVLRQSTGQNDFGCQCDIKIHGFSDRLLRFDLVVFEDDDVQIKDTGRKTLRYSFAGVDFSRMCSEASIGNNKLDTYTDSGTNNRTSDGGYTIESVISKLNSIVVWDRQAQKSWIHGLTHFLEEHLSLGVTKVEGEDDANAIL